jgi:hypothetical protein
MTSNDGNDTSCVICNIYTHDNSNATTTTTYNRSRTQR